VSVSTAGTGAALDATAPWALRPPARSSGSPAASAIGSSRFAAIRMSVAFTFSSITARTASVFRGPARRGADTGSAARFASITRSTVSRVVPNAAAPRWVPTCS
jgi:hypothetical protein